MHAMIENNYRAAFKLATTELHEAQSGPNYGKKGFSAIAICNRINNSHLNGEHDKKLKLSTVQKAVDSGAVGALPLKDSRPKSIPPQFTQALAIHSTMKQVAGCDGEASGRNMTALIKAATDGTEWENKFSPTYAWRRARGDHPEMFVPCKAKNHKDTQAEWMTVQNIHDWFDNHKKYMSDNDFVRTKAGYISKLLFILFTLLYKV